MAVFRRKKADGSQYETFTCDFVYRGVRVNADTGATSKSEAKKWETNRRRELAEEVASRRLTRKPKVLTVRQAMERYKEEQLSLSGSYETTDRFLADRLVREIGPDLPLEELTTAVVKPLVARKVRSGLAPSSVVREINILAAMHNHARDIWEYPGLRPVAWKKVRPKVPKTERQIPQVERVRDLVQAASPRLALVIMFAVLTGLRRREIQRLERANLDVDKRELRFTGKGKYTVNHPISSAALSTINSALTLQASSMQLGHSSKLFDMTNFRREWTEAKERAGLPPRTRFHDLRHVYATLVKAATKDPVQLMRAMRHADIATSLGYVHADKSDLSPLLENVAQELLKASPKPSKPSLPWKSDEPDEQPTDE